MKASHFPSLAAAIVLLPLVAEADNLLKNASFEQPRVTERTDGTKGGNPSQTDKETIWTGFRATNPDGKIKVGLTNEMSHSGTQSIFVEFNRTGVGKGAFLMSDLIPIKPASNYRLSMWGRLDPKRPLTLGRGRPILRVQVEYYQADQGTQTGDTDYRTQMIPGSPRRVLFVTGKWNEYYTELKSPDDADFMKFTFLWDPPAAEEGAADGVIYFDDAVLEGTAGTLVPSADAEVGSVPPTVPAAPAPAPAEPSPAPLTPAK